MLPCLGLPAATSCDKNPFVLPDVVADLTEPCESAFRRASVDLVLPMHCFFGVFGTWDAPNQRIFDAAAAWLRPGGVLLVVLPDASLGVESAAAGFARRLPAALRGSGSSAQPIVDALGRAEDASERRRVREQVARALPGAGRALLWLDAHLRDEGHWQHSAAASRLRMPSCGARPRSWGGCTPSRAARCGRRRAQCRRSGCPSAPSRTGAASCCNGATARKRARGSG
jgi:hypothetical protein